MLLELTWLVVGCGAPARVELGLRRVYSRYGHTVILVGLGGVGLA